MEATEATETQPAEQQRVARRAFAGVIVVLAVVYGLRNFDRYEAVNAEFRYRELVDLVEPIKDTMETALLSGSISDIEEFQSGTAGLPEEVFATEDAHGVSVIEGQIIATWMSDESDLDGVTYILTPSIEDDGVEWETTGTCGSKKAC
ncbi:MAG: hypothetical protein AAF918_15470 [Pseudomonadota bacterium]